MSEPFLAEIRVFGFNFPPAGWAQCDGQILPISQNQSLYSLLGTTYGGDGETTFALPDLRSRVPIHRGELAGDTYAQGQRGGADAVFLTEQTIPPHSHTLQAFSDNANSAEPESNRLARAEMNTYASGGTSTALHAGSITAGSGGQSHTNTQPSIALNFCIALQGLFPSPS